MFGRHKACPGGEHVQVTTLEDSDGPASRMAAIHLPFYPGHVSVSSIVPGLRAYEADQLFCNSNIGLTGAFQDDRASRRSIQVETCGTCSRDMFEPFR
jgi:hypothetical protein